MKRQTMQFQVMCFSLRDTWLIQEPLEWELLKYEEPLNNNDLNIRQLRLLTTILEPIILCPWVSFTDTIKTLPDFQLKVCNKRGLLDQLAPKKVLLLVHKGNHLPKVWKMWDLNTTNKFLQVKLRMKDYHLLKWPHIIKLKNFQKKIILTKKLSF